MLTLRAVRAVDLVVETLCVLIPIVWQRLFYFSSLDNPFAVCLAYHRLNSLQIPGNRLYLNNNTSISRLQ